MAVRTVSVTLKMQISDFELAAAKAAAITKALGDDFDHMGTSANKVSTAKPTKEIQNFSRVINGALKDGKTGFESIQSAIDDTKTHIASLRNQIKTGAGSESLFGDLKSAQKDLRTLEGIFKDLTPAASQGGTEAGSSFVKSFGTEAVKLGDVAGPTGLAFGVALAVVATPVIVSALTAAVAGGIGLGVIAAGALIEKNDPQIQAALAPLKKTISTTLTDAASPLQQSFVDAIHSADLFVAREGPALRAMFASVAPAVGLVTSGIESLISKLLPQFTAIGREFTTALSNPQVHQALTNASADFVNLFKVIGNNPQVIAVGFETLGKAVSFVSGFMSGLINISGSVIRGFDATTKALGDFFGASNASTDKLNLLNLQFPDLAQNAQAAVPALHSVFTAISSGATAVDQMARSAELAAPDLKALESTLSATKITSDTLAASLEDKVFTTMMNSDLATLGWNESLTNLSATLKTNKGVIDENAQSTIKHRQAAEADKGAILAAVSANQQVYQSMVASGISAEDAAKAYGSNEKALRKQLLAAGLTKKQVDGLIGTYDKVPANVNTVLAVKGLTDAINNLDTTLRLLNHLDGFNATATVTTHYKTIGRPPGQARPNRWGNIYEPAADGLLTHAQVYTPVNPGRFMIAEPQTGGEAFIPKNGDYGRSMSILSAAAGWYGARVVEGGGGGGGGGGVNITVSAAPNMPQQFMSWFRFQIDQAGGDPVRVLTPRGV